MNILAKLATAATAALLIAAGTTLPATAATNTPTAAHTWDCDTLGVKQCKGSVKTIGDAWESMEYMAKVPRYDRTHVLRYVRTVHTRPTARAHEVVVKSVNLPRTWHVLTYKK